MFSDIHGHFLSQHFSPCLHLWPRIREKVGAEHISFSSILQRQHADSLSLMTRYLVWVNATCKCESKLADCVTQCKNLAQDIVCMQETRIRGEGEIKFDDCVLKDWHVIYNGMSIARAGVAIVMAPHVRLMDVEHIMEGRITMIRVKVHGVKLAIYSCYSPTEEYSTSSKETFHRTLQRAMLQMRKEHPSYKIIVAGDFNATIGQDCNHDT